MSGKKKWEIAGGGHRDYFLDFVRRNPETKTAREYKNQLESEDCIPIEQVPDIPMDILHGYVAAEDYELYLEGCDLREEEG